MYSSVSKYMRNERCFHSGSSTNYDSYPTLDIIFHLYFQRNLSVSWKKKNTHHMSMLIHQRHKSRIQDYLSFVAKIDVSFMHRCSWRSWPASRSTRTPREPSATSRYGIRSARPRVFCTLTSSARSATRRTSRSSASRRPIIQTSAIPRSTGTLPRSRYDICSEAQVIQCFSFIYPSFLLAYDPLLGLY